MSKLAFLCALIAVCACVSVCVGSEDIKTRKIVVSDINQKLVEIFFERFDMIAEEIEQKIAIPLEKDLAGILGVGSIITVNSWEGCKVILEASDEKSLDLALPLVKENLRKLVQAGVIPRPSYVLKQIDLVPFGVVVLSVDAAAAEVAELSGKLSTLKGVSWNEYATAIPPVDRTGVSNKDDFYYHPLVMNFSDGLEKSVMPAVRKLYRHNGNPCAGISLYAYKDADPVKLQQDIQAIIGEYAAGGRKAIFFRKEVDDSGFTVFFELPAGTKQNVAVDELVKVEKVLKDTPEIEDFVSEVGLWSHSISVMLSPQDRSIRRVNNIVFRLNDVTKSFSLPFIYYVPWQKPQKSAPEVMIELFGQDYEVLRDFASKAARKLEDIKGIANVKKRMREGQLCFKVEADSAVCKANGLSADEFIQQTMFFYKSPLGANLNSLVFVTSQGKYVPFVDIAKIKYDIMPAEIWRKNSFRMVQVSGEIIEADSGYEKKIKSGISSIDFPKGYSFDVLQIE